MQDSTYTVYAYPFRSRAERVIWMLQELNLPFQVVRLSPFKEDGLKNPDLLKINPDGKVPVLEYQGKYFTDSSAIMEYLAAMYPSAQLTPSDPETLYTFRQCAYYLLTEVESYLWIGEQSGRLNTYYHWPKDTHSNALRLAQQNIMKVFTWLKDRDYVAGAHFTCVDILAYHIITWAHALGIPHPTDVDKYLSKLRSRPSFPESMNA